MATRKQKNSTNVQQFSTLAKEKAERWSAQIFVEAFLGKESFEKVENGEEMQFKAFSVTMKSGKIYMRHNDRNGNSGAEIEITAKNAERLYFAASVDNHLLANWPHVTYEQPDGSGGRADVALWSADPEKGGKVLALYENKQANAYGTDYHYRAQRENAISQLVSRIERLHKTNPSALGQTISLSISLFDKDTLNLSSAGEYYSNHAKSFKDDEDREALAEAALDQSGMWIESWIIDAMELMRQPADQRKAWLVSRLSATSSPMIPLAAMPGSRVATSGLNENIAKNRLVYSTFGSMMNYPALNPAGFSAAQNPRNHDKRIARKLAGPIANSILYNFISWRENGGSSSKGVQDETFFTLGSNNRELHLVQSSCYEVDPGSRGGYAGIWMCGDVGFANGQHSTDAFEMLGQALANADISTIDAFSKTIIRDDVFNGPGSSRQNRDALREKLEQASKLHGVTPAEVKYFFDQVIVQTSIKYARDDEHSSRLSYESNNAVSQDPEDLMIHQNRSQIKGVMAALAKECSANKRVMPVVMAKNHQTEMATKMNRESEVVFIQNAMQWLAADAMFSEKKWGPGRDWLESTLKAPSASRRKFMEANAPVIAKSYADAGVPIDMDTAYEMARKLAGYQVIYQIMFASTKKDRENAYRDIEKRLFSGADLLQDMQEDISELIDNFDYRKSSSTEASEQLRIYQEKYMQGLSLAASQGWITQGFLKKTIPAIEYAIEQISSDQDGAKENIKKIEAEARDAIKEIGSMASKPTLLHAAAICSRALSEFKTEECQKARDSAAKSGPKKKSKNGKEIEKFSELLAQSRYSFWAKEASFDMLVCAQMARAFGSVLASDQYKIEPDAGDGSAWPERLAARVKAVAATTLEKIELMSREVHHQNSSAVSHLYRSLPGAASLAADQSGQGLISDALAQTDAGGINAFVYYEWLLNGGVPSIPGRPVAPGAAPVEWPDDAVRSRPAKKRAATSKLGSKNRR